MATRTSELRDLAQRIADALPADVAEEIMLTGSVSRGVADELSDIEMLIVTPDQLDLETCFDHARSVGFQRPDTWGEQSSPVRRVFGYCEGVPVELIWWSRDYADSRIDAMRVGESPAAADAIVYGAPLR